METPSQSPLIKILTYIPWAERIFAVASVIAFILTFIGNPSKPLLIISLVGLGISFFLSSFIPIDIPHNENERFDFIHLLALIIVPKIVFIGTAIGVMGILINQLGLPLERYAQLFLASAIIIAGSFIAILAAMAMGVKHIRSILPIYFRAIPVLFVMAYLYFYP